MFRSLSLIGIVSLQCACGVSGDKSAHLGIVDQRSPYYNLATFTDLRDSMLVRQGRDFSCGAAALATVLTYHWNDKVSEENVLDVLAQILSKEELTNRRTSGFTLLDLQLVAKAYGYRAQGFRVPASQIEKIRQPIIVFVKPFGYKHFVVFRGIFGDRALLADPSRGNLTLPVYQFRNWWQDEDGNGIVLAVEPLTGDSTDADLRGALNLQAIDFNRPALIDVRSLLPEATLLNTGSLSIR